MPARPPLPLPLLPRRLASTSASAPLPRPTPAAFTVFDRRAKALQRDRAASDVQQSRTVDYLREAVADNLRERVLDIKRRFPRLAVLGSGGSHVARAVDEEGVADEILVGDSSEKALLRDSEFDDEMNSKPVRHHLDEEHLSLSPAFAPNSLDGVISSLGLHWVNDLPGALIQIHQALKPDGVFLGAMFGGDTLFELRTALQLASTERLGGVSPHVSPMTDTRDVGSLLTRAGYTLLTVDLDDITVAYPSMWELVDDLRAMGESNAVFGRPKVLKRDVLVAAGEIYKELHGNEDGTVPATFQIIYMIGWKPAPGQFKPLKRGSAERSMKDVLQE